MRKLVIMVAGVAAVAFLAAPTAYGLGVAAKLKAKKVAGNFVPALSPVDTGEGTGDDENDSPAFQDAMYFRSTAGNDCSFLQGQFKVQVGKDARVKVKGVECGGTPYTGQLCAHVKSVATIMNEDIAKDGSAAPKTCIHPVAGNIAGTGNFVTATIGVIPCSAGKCDGTLQTVTIDPCPDVDKVNEIRRIELFDGPDKGEVTILGNTLTACCGPGQTAVGNLGLGGVPPCNTSIQKVLGEAGNLSQGVAP